VTPGAASILNLIQAPSHLRRWFKKLAERSGAGERLLARAWSEANRAERGETASFDVTLPRELKLPDYLYTQTIKL
jgi:hypothetical protein